MVILVMKWLNIHMCSLQNLKAWPILTKTLLEHITHQYVYIMASLYTHIRSQTILGAMKNARKRATTFFITKRKRYIIALDLNMAPISITCLLSLHPHKIFKDMKMRALYPLVILLYW